MQGGIYINGQRPKSKAAIKRAMTDPNSTIIFDCTDAFGANAGQTFNLNDMPAGNHVIVGPDPYTKRNFYGTIHARNGNVTIS